MQLSNFLTKNYILRKVGETPLTPIHSALDRERPLMDRDALLQPVQNPEVTSQCQFSSIRCFSIPSTQTSDLRPW